MVRWYLVSLGIFTERMTAILHNCIHSLHSRRAAGSSLGALRHFNNIRTRMFRISNDIIIIIIFFSFDFVVELKFGKVSIYTCFFFLESILEILYVNEKFVVLAKEIFFRNPFF